MPIIKLPNANDAAFRAIAVLHQSSIATGFLSTLGIAFLARMYAAIARHSRSAVFGAYDDDAGDGAAPIGFVAGTVDIKAMYRKVLVREGAFLGLLLLPNLFSFKRLRRIVETLFYARRSDAAPGFMNAELRNFEAPGLPPAELLAVAVDAAHRGKGAGKRLVAVLEKWYSEQGVKEYRVVTWSRDASSNAFYQACGFAKAREFGHHGNVMNEYRKSIGGANG
jgi:GNAT superfamily N-acetyltransferase